MEDAEAMAAIIVEVAESSAPRKLFVASEAEFNEEEGRLERNDPTQSKADADTVDFVRKLTVNGKGDFRPKKGV